MSTQFNLHYLPLALLSLPLLPAANSHAAGVTTMVSVSSVGEQGNYSSLTPATNADGRYVAFWSGASNLVPGDTNDKEDVFVHDRLSRTTTRVSVSSAGGQGNSFSRGRPSISADGRYVTFTSAASNLVPEDTNRESDVFVHDRTTGETTRVSVDSAGGQGNGGSGPSSISADGRYEVFASGASNLVPMDTNGHSDVFVHDRSNGTTTRVSVDSAGKQGNDGSADDVFSLAISAEGRYVAFQSWATNLVPGDSNEAQDVFVHDRTTGITERVSVDSAGVQGVSRSFDPSISANGRYVAFTSVADNLVPGDSNEAQNAFVHDRTTGITERVNVSSKGNQGNDDSFTIHPSISADGRYVAFQSDAFNLVPRDSNEVLDVFVHDRTNHTTTRVNISSTGQQASGYGSGQSSISADGRYVAFFSGANNLVPGDTQDIQHDYDIFVRDRSLNTDQNADLQVTVTSQPASVQNGDVGRYLFTITNNGPDNIDAVRLIDSVSGGKVWSLTPSQGYCSEAAVSVCRLHALEAGESATIRTVFKAKADPLIQNITVSAAPLDNVSDNNRITVSTPVTP